MKWYRLVSMMFVGVFLLGNAMLQPALAQLRENEPGSFLVYPLFDINPGNQTLIRITNNGTITVDVRINTVCPGTASGNGTYQPFCDGFDQRTSLSAHATQVFDVATQLFPPCPEGFIVVFAQERSALTGLYNPISWNSLLGSFQVTYGSGGDTTAEAADAIAIQSPQGPLNELGFDDGGLLGLSFGTPAASQSTADYVALPLVLVGDFAAIGGALSPAATATETDTRLILLTLSFLTGATNPVARASILTWDAVENGPFSTAREFICWDRIDVSDPQSTVFKKSPAGFLGTDYGSLRVTFNASGISAGTYNPAGLGAIEEVSSLGGATLRGNTIRNLFHAGMKSTTFITDNE